MKRGFWGSRGVKGCRVPGRVQGFRACKGLAGLEGVQALRWLKGFT